ncbi:MAG: NUDIX domain-containing protein [Saprospiraceae bacterium]
MARHLNKGIMLGIKKVAAMVILRHQDKFLLLKRAKSPNQGMYVPVGGKLEPFETPRAAAIRETYEETGIQLTEVKFCGTLVETSPVKYNWISYIYLAEIDDLPVPDCDEGVLEWIEKTELDRVPAPPTDTFIYEYVAQEKPFAFSATFSDDLKMLKMHDEWSGEVVFSVEN